MTQLELIKKGVATLNKEQSTFGSSRYKLSKVKDGYKLWWDDELIVYGTVEDVYSVVASLVSSSYPNYTPSDEYQRQQMLEFNESVRRRKTNCMGKKMRY